MRIGFIGAGRMGFTLGKHISTCQKEMLVSGYYSRSRESAREAAKFTDTKYYDNLEALVAASDIIFITVPDIEIAVIAKRLDGLAGLVRDKIICHTSGALSSQVFSGMNSKIYGYSVHPIYAVSSKTESYKNFKDCFITIEGDERYLDCLTNLFRQMGHTVKRIETSSKVKYHAGAVFASNLVIGLYHMALRQLIECGFSEKEGQEALRSLFINNAEALIERGEENALTGPVDRNDIETVKKHLSVLNGESNQVYRFLSKELLDITAGKYPDRDNEEMKSILERK